MIYNVLFNSLFKSFICLLQNDNFNTCTYSTLKHTHSYEHKRTYMNTLAHIYSYTFMRIYTLAHIYALRRTHVYARIHERIILICDFASDNNF